jgi:hypothetical protein
MGHLLSSAIKMQGAGVPTTATININNVDGVTVTWTKNGISQGSVAVTVTETLNVGDTFSVTSSDVFGSNVAYYLNGTFTTNYFGNPSVTTPTLTAIGGNTYRYDCFGGA